MFAASEKDNSTQANLAATLATLRSTSWEHASYSRRHHDLERVAVKIGHAFKSETDGGVEVIMRRLQDEPAIRALRAALARTPSKHLTIARTSPGNGKSRSIAKQTFSLSTLAEAVSCGDCEVTNAVLIGDAGNSVDGKMVEVVAGVEAGTVIWLLSCDRMGRGFEQLKRVADAAVKRKAAIVLLFLLTDCLDIDDPQELLALLYASRGGAEAAVKAVPDVYDKVKRLLKKAGRPDIRLPCRDVFFPFPIVDFNGNRPLFDVESFSIRAESTKSFLGTFKSVEPLSQTSSFINSGDVIQQNLLDWMLHDETKKNVSEPVRTEAQKVIESIGFKHVSVQQSPKSGFVECPCRKENALHGDTNCSCWCEVCKLLEGDICRCGTPGCASLLCPCGCTQCRVDPEAKSIIMEMEEDGDESFSMYRRELLCAREKSICVFRHLLPPPPDGKGRGLLERCAFLRFYSTFVMCSGYLLEQVFFSGEYALRHYYQDQPVTDANRRSFKGTLARPPETAWCHTTLEAKWLVLDSPQHQEEEYRNNLVARWSAANANGRRFFLRNTDPVTIDQFIASILRTPLLVAQR